MLPSRAVRAVSLVGFVLALAGCGTSPSSPSAPGPAAATLVLVSHRSELVAYRPDPATGALTLSARTSWTTAARATVDPRGRFLFTSARDENVAWRLRADGSATLSVRNARGPGTLHPSGRFGYGIRGVVGPLDCEIDGRGSAATVDPSNGAVAELADGGFTTGVAPRSIAFAARGAFAYVANSGDPTVLYGPCRGGSLTGYRVDATTGRLQPLGTFAEDRAHELVRTDLDGRFLFVAQKREYGNELRGPSPAGLAVYAIDPSSGALRPAPGGFFELPAGHRPFELAVDPLGRLAFLSALDPDGDDAMWLYTLQVGAEGQLTPLGQARPWGELAVGARQRALHFSPDGRFAYVEFPVPSELHVARVDLARGLVESGVAPLVLGADALGVAVVQPSAE